MKIAVGISGGVDSAVAAELLIRRGNAVVGVTMTLGRDGEEHTLAEARAVASRLGIELLTCDLAAAWRETVLGGVRSAYRRGLTPNPCVSCNETVKFGLLPAFAFAAGCDLFATGHYARLEGGRLFRATDHAKDQSYFLYRVRPDVLARVIFPLGGLTKAQVRAEAHASGLAAADKGDSQDFCGGDPRAALGTGDREGAVVTVDGRIVGRHRGYWHYTPGQRKGLGIGGGVPYYVLALRPETNEVVVGFRDAAVTHVFRVERFVTHPGWARATLGKDLAVKVRSAGEPCGPCRVTPLGDGEVRVECPVGLATVAPGQSAVFYLDGEVLGGGFIASSD